MLKEVLYYFEVIDESLVQLNKYLINDHFEFKKFPITKFRGKLKLLFMKQMLMTIRS